MELPMAIYYANNRTEHISMMFEPLLSQSCMSIILLWKNDVTHPFTMSVDSATGK